VRELLARFKGSAPGAWHEREQLLRQMLPHVGGGIAIRPPFYCEFGAISIGDRTFINVDAVMLDVAPITIGAARQIATRVQLLTAAHTIDPEPPGRLGVRGADHGRRQRLAGRRRHPLPGVTIGQDIVVGAGAVVTQTCPPASSRPACRPESGARSAKMTASRSRRAPDPARTNDRPATEKRVGVSS
jgi:maltose O-acetyltransferase